ncbi:MAG: LuxR C-terminal-related transcriptional regulator [Dermatophilaceae bacterium]
MTVISITPARERVRTTLAELARTPPPLEQFVAAVKDEVGRVLPAAAIAVGTLDPETAVPNGGCFSPVEGSSAEDVATAARRWAEIEYGDPEPSALQVMHRRGVTALGMVQETHGSPERSRRMRELMLPVGITDEVRMLGYAGGRPWAALMLFRTGGSFTADDVAFVASLSSAVGRGVRACVLQSAYGMRYPEPGARSLVVGPGGEIVLATAEARNWFARMLAENGAQASAAVVPGLIARLGSAAESPGEAHTRIHRRDGQWFTASAERLLGPGGSPDGHVVVTIVASEPHELAPLLFESLGLTPREQAVTRLVMDGLDTRRIAGRLGLSAYTVQDHLKSVFGKAGVMSRGQLVARIEGRA